MACCLTAPSHYLNQCWRIIKGVLWHSHKTVLKNTDLKNEFEKHIGKITSPFRRGQWVDMPRYTGTTPTTEACSIGWIQALLRVVMVYVWVMTFTLKPCHMDTSTFTGQFIVWSIDYSGTYAYFPRIIHMVLLRFVLSRLYYQLLLNYWIKVSYSPISFTFILAMTVPVPVK